MNGFAERKRNSESRMRENRLSGLMRGGKQTVIGPRAFQSAASRLLYRSFRGRVGGRANAALIAPHLITPKDVLVSGRGREGWYSKPNCSDASIERHRDRAGAIEWDYEWCKDHGHGGRWKLNVGS